MCITPTPGCAAHQHPLKLYLQELDVGILGLVRIPPMRNASKFANVLSLPGMLRGEVSRNVQLSIKHDADNYAPSLPKGMLANIWVRQDPGRVCHASPQQLPRIQEQQACDAPSSSIGEAKWTLFTHLPGVRSARPTDPAATWSMHHTLHLTSTASCFSFKLKKRCGSG